MLNWFLSNLGTIILTIILLSIVTLILVSIRKKKKRGVSPCGCNCSECTLNCSSHKK